MAKAAVARQQTPTSARETQAVARTQVGGPPAALMEEARGTAGMGTSKDQADNLVPLIYVLQAQSPQATKRNPAYIAGAEAGNIWLRSAPEPIVPGDEGILFQPCYFSKCVIEWIHRDDGGGFVARHKTMPADAERVVDPKDPNKVSWVSKKNRRHQYVETREHVGYVIRPGKPPMPYVIPMSGSGHKVSREWMFLMNSKVMEDTGETYGSFCFLYRLTTKFVQNVKGEWFLWNVADAGWVQSAEDIRRGKALHDAFNTGEKQADTTAYAEGAVDTGVDDDPEDDEDGRP